LGSIAGMGERLFSTPKRPDQLWGVKLTTHLRLVLRSKMLELYLHSPMCLNGN
jgi:hypothetical protein